MYVLLSTSPHFFLKIAFFPGLSSVIDGGGYHKVTQKMLLKSTVIPLRYEGLKIGSCIRRNQYNLWHQQHLRSIIVALVTLQAQHLRLRSAYCEYCEESACFPKIPTIGDPDFAVFYYVYAGSSPCLCRTWTSTGFRSCFKYAAPANCVQSPCH